MTVMRIEAELIDICTKQKENPIMQYNPIVHGGGGGGAFSPHHQTDNTSPL